MFDKGNRSNTFHGLMLIALFTFASFYISELQWVKNLSLSPLIVGIVLGTIYANTLRSKLPETWVPGIKFCTKQILRTGIVLYGFRLTLSDVYAVGLPAVIVDLIIVCGTLGIGIVLGRILKMDPETALMTSTGSAICGAAAVLGAESVVKCASHKTAVAVSTVVIFGTIAMFLYPVMYRAGLLDALGDTGAAIYTGATLHEVAHVAAAGNAMDPADNLGIAATATITKMIRVMMLAPVLVVMAIMLSRLRNRHIRHNDKEAAQAAYAYASTTADIAGDVQAQKEITQVPAKTKTKITIPYFALGFLLVICINTLLGNIFNAETVKDIPLNKTIEYIDTFLLTMAMTALGTDTSIDKFKAAGARPFLLASLLFVWLLVGGYILALYLPPLLG